mgnify:CR=1 FL=1
MKIIKTYFFVPILTIGLTMILLGVRWMVVDEPWMLDEVANIERLEMTFETLFDSEINSTLPGYLKQIYRFFGLWVIVIGLFISSFSTPNLVTNKQIRVRLLICIGIMILIGTILGYLLIPSSPFIYLTWVMTIFYFISLYGHLKLIQINN